MHVGHGTYVCRNRLRCSKCNRKHHDLIHDDAFVKKENNETTTTPSATISCTLQSHNVYLRTLPVRVSSGDKEIIAVALLDGGAQSSLGTDDLFKKLGINERPSNLKLTTVTGETTEYKSMTANIFVKPLDCSHTVPMDHVRSIPKLPIAKSCSAKKKDIKNVEHLRDILIATMDQPVSLLIGADTPEAFFTLDEKRGNRDQPIAIKTPLGWTVQGPCHAVSTNTIDLS